jgi:hypothetical protein
MRLISNMICVLLLVAIVLTSSGCCVLSGYGMKNAQIEAKKKHDAFHKSVMDAMERAQ